MSIITLTGSLGSGKSTVGAILEERLNYKYIDGGIVFRELAKELNLTVTDINKKAESDKEIDKKIDDYLVSLSTKSNTIVDSRLAWHFVKKSFKVYLYVSTDIAVERISNSGRTTEGDINDKIKLKENLEKRKQIEETRFKDLYNIDVNNYNNYDLFLDTSKLTPEEVVERILFEYKIDEMYEYDLKEYYENVV